MNEPATLTRTSATSAGSQYPLIGAGILLGMGFGGLADGILLHQILGWHHLVCFNAHCVPASVAQFALENTQDGYFHLWLWLVLMAGTLLLFRVLNRSRRTWPGTLLAGAMLAGSGVFNFLEGLLNHQILGIHHVLPGNPHQLLFDLLYLANGVLFALVGAWLIRRPGTGFAKKNIIRIQQNPTAG